MLRRFAGLLPGLALVASLAAPTLVSAGGISGAIFTTDFTGTEVNGNIYATKDQVYLNGGPGVNAPATAAGLPDGSYVFQVTDPSGKTLLSSDAAGCRQFTVAGGLITSIVPYSFKGSACQHNPGTLSGPSGVTVQLIPYANTPNNGDVYKAWATPLGDYQAGCQALGVPILSALNTVDCGSAPADQHGFVPANSKVDNFKVKTLTGMHEIDTRFFQDLNGDGIKEDNEPFIDGLAVTWTDPLGASDTRWSEYNPSVEAFDEAHVEDVENGVHQITIANQTGCTVGMVSQPDYTDVAGPQTVSITVNLTPSQKTTDVTYRVDVACE